MFTFFKKLRKKPAPAEVSGTPEPVFTFSGWVVSDLGRVRENNEDNFLLGPHYNTDSRDHITASHSAPEGWTLAGVFDGMGGGEAGELASRAAAEACLERFSALPGDAGETLVEQALRRAYLEANNRIQALHSQYRVFGTTGTVLCTAGRRFKLFHLGDSRCYLLRDGQLTQLTKDQTLAQMKLEMGLYDENDPQAQAEKHKLTEFIGRDWTRENLKPTETVWNPIHPGDMLLLCSDGLYDLCTDGEILEILTGEGTPEEKAQALTDAAIAAGGHDNITCLITVFSGQ